MRYKFCPECGRMLVDRKAGDEGNVPYCETCEKYWFDTFASCVIIMVVNDEDEVALLTQSYLSSEYKSFVAGYITPGETAEETAVREVKEEIGVDIERLDYEGTHWFAAREQLMHGYVGYAKKCELVLSEEVDEAEWVPVKDAQPLMFPDTPDNVMHHLYRKYLKDTGR